MNLFPDNNIRKISITGPESCGKSTLAKALAREGEFPLVHEYARHYLHSGGTVRNSLDLVKIAKKQIEAEQAMISENQDTIICDTDILVLYIWCKDKFPPVPPALQALLKYHRYEFTLLCSPDLPWIPDPLRQNQFDRDRLFAEYLEMLKRLERPFEIIHGHGKARLEQAKKRINTLIK